MLFTSVSAPPGAPATDTAVQRFVWIVLLPAILLTGIAWATLRINLESRLTTAAQRDLQTIVDFVAADIEGMAAARPSLKGTALAREAAGAGTLLAQSLQRANNEHFRNVYFFDAAGHVTTADTDDGPAVAPPMIVLQALEDTRLAVAVDHGDVSEPYRDLTGEEAIGAWRWLPGAAVGVVAERPYERFSQPLDWIDGIFAAVLATLVVGTFLVDFRSLGDLLSAFRRSDIRRCGPYVIERLIGEGSMSNVYLARHQQLGRRVALKRLKIHTQNDELSARFDREVRLASRLSHPNIVTVLDYGRVADGGFYYAMEFIRGLSLAQWVQQHGPVPPARAIRLLQQVCAAVGAMHDAGLLHRDIKPDNVMAYAANGDYDLVKLLDFGLIKNLENHETRDLTSSVRVLGTPAYMAPERLVDPRSIDPRTDIYGIGCIAFYLLTGRKPFESAMDTDLTQQILHIDAPAVAGLSPFSVPAELTELIAATLAKDMAQRPATAKALGAALAQISAQAPWRRERARLWWESVFGDTPGDGAAPGSATAAGIDSI